MGQTAVAVKFDYFGVTGRKANESITLLEALRRSTVGVMREARRAAFLIGVISC